MLLSIVWDLLFGVVSRFFVGGCYLTKERWQPVRAMCM